MYLVCTLLVLQQANHCVSFYQFNPAVRNLQLTIWLDGDRSNRNIQFKLAQSEHYSLAKTFKMFNSISFNFVQ